MRAPYGKVNYARTQVMVVTHGNTLVNKISFASVAKAVGEAAFVTSQAPVILSLEMHCGEKQQARISSVQFILAKNLGKPTRRVCRDYSPASAGKAHTAPTPPNRHA